MPGKQDPKKTQKKEGKTKHRFKCQSNLGTSIIFPDEFRSPFVGLIKLVFIICQIKVEKG